MRSLLGRAAARAGLVSRAKYVQASEALQRANGKIAELKELLEAARADSRALKAKVEEVTGRLTHQRDEDSAKHAKRAAKATEELERVRAREEKHRVVIAELREKAISSERAVRIAREQLMAVEVKLDIIEGAITVLDGRTRAALKAADRASAAAPTPDARSAR
jgi:chromosome segregation ATPase